MFAEGTSKRSVQTTKADQAFNVNVQHSVQMTTPRKATRTVSMMVLKMRLLQAHGESTATTT